MTSKKKWQIYLEERDKGMTYAEIAAKYGVSHQAVAQTCARRSACHFKPYTEKECIYPNLRKWLNENRVMRNELARRMYGTDVVFPYEDMCPLQCEDPYYNQMMDGDFFCANGERRSE